ncbi:MAG: hypothetical protein PHN84_13355 [Desulfuromonadaceae bacterium]|nr:hypothetical protein [Desulfuromonadaceae bacterium]MDD2855578.1 hypothetical protein [Desulfuromonadaceae bacterium]
MENISAEQLKYDSVMKKTRSRRKLFFATILLYIPALIVTHQVSPTNSAMGTLFAGWVALLIISTFILAHTRCPGCGNYFHLHGLTLLVLRKCLHCQLHISTDRIEHIENIREDADK